MYDELSARKAQAEAKFNELTKEKTNLQARITEIDSELIRLQGEFRVCEDLLKSLDDKKKPKKASPKDGEVVDAATITVEEPKE